MSIKVIAGAFGSRALKSVRGIGTRPLLNQVRESIFNILADRVEDAFVWDLFAGTGASGIEALSRGARRVAFLEKSNKALEILRGNLEMLGQDALDRSEVLRADAWDPPVMHRSLFGDTRGDVDAAPDAEVAPDLIFLDPPYAMVEEDPVKSVYRAGQLVRRLAPGGCLVFHFVDGRLEEDDFDADLEVDLRTYGTSVIAFIEAPRSRIDDGAPEPARAVAGEPEPELELEPRPKKVRRRRARRVKDEAATPIEPD